MDTIPLTLPDDTRRFVESQAVAGGFSTAAAYVEQLIETERRRKSQAELEALLLSGVRGPGAELTPQAWQAMRQEANELAKPSVPI
jgi:antitoxin ParD1/3/4